MGHSVCYISTDWFYRTKPADVTHHNYNYDTPTAFDFQPLILALQSRQAVSLPGYDYVHHCSLSDQHQYDPHSDFIMIEGIMLLNDPTLRSLIQMKIYVNTDLDVCLARRILRDLKDRGRTVETVITQWFETVKPGYEAFIVPTMKYADYIFNNTQESLEQNMRQDGQKLLLLLLQQLSDQSHFDKKGKY
jgi:uridine kinase